MKRFIAFGSAILVSALIICSAMAVAVPDWLPDGIRARIPFASNTSPDAESGSEDIGLYCKEHGVPEKFCTICHVELNETLLLCKEHGNIPEDICTLCHPDVEKKNRIEMCPKGHGLPREFCYECGKTSTASTNVPDDGWCTPHNKPESLCLECEGKPATFDSASSLEKVCRQPLPTVRFSTSKLADQIGIRTAKLVEESYAQTLSANAEVAYDSNRYADITPRVSGFLSQVNADLGATVKRGDVLAVVDSPDISAAKAQYVNSHAQMVLAQVTYDRTKPLARAGTIPGKTELETLTELTKAKAAVLEAKQRLKNFGFGDSDLERFIQSEDTDSRLPVTSPINGIVVVRHAVKGEPVESTARIFEVTDTSKMWIWIDIYEADIQSVKVGQTVMFSITGEPKDEIAGTVNWVGSEVDPQTRTSKVRAEIDNPAGRLRANQFGIARVRIGDEHRALLIPKAAVQTKDGANIVFLPQEAPGIYLPRHVVVEPTDRTDLLEVTWGLKPGDQVVTTGSFLLKTEIMKGAIGAGCCE